MLIGSFLPGEGKRALGTQSGDYEGPRWGHRLYHLGSFGLTALLVSLVNRNANRRVMMCVAVVGLGIAIETLQSVVFGSEVEGRDMADNFIGVLIAWMIGEIGIVRRRLVSD